MPIICTPSTAIWTATTCSSTCGAARVGGRWTYAAVYDLVRRLRRRTGVDFDPHWLRHTAATRMLRDGIGIEVVARLSGHANVTTTAAIYGHLTVEDARRGDGAGGLVHRWAGVAVTAPAGRRAARQWACWAR